MKPVKLFEEFISEGIHDLNTLKAFFMAGGPGSGKSHVASEIFGFPHDAINSISYRTGLKLINSDIAFEVMLKGMGIDPKNLAELDPIEFAKLTQGPDSPRERAKKITIMKKDFYKEGRLGMVIDGTGDDFSKIKVKKDELEEFGYDTYMVFINTSLEVAQARNARRTRTLPEELVSDIWHAVQDNIGAFQREFGSQNMVIVDNSVDGDVSFSDIEKVLSKLLKKPIQNSIGRKWLKGE